MSVIDINKLKNADMHELLRLAYLMDSESVKRAYQKVGVTVDSEDDLEALANLHYSRGDIAGVLKDSLGRPVRFSVEQTLANMRTPENFKEKLVNLKWS